MIHVFLALCGGTLPIVDAEIPRISILTKKCGGNAKTYPLTFEDIERGRQTVEADLKGQGLPESDWEGVEWSIYGAGPGRDYSWQSVKSVGVNVRRIGSAWRIIDAGKSNIARSEKGEPRLHPLTPEKLEVIRVEAEKAAQAVEYEDLSDVYWPRWDIQPRKRRFSK